MSILRPLCWLTGHDWCKKMETNSKIIEECRFCGKIRELRK